MAGSKKIQDSNPSPFFELAQKFGFGGKAKAPPSSAPQGPTLDSYSTCNSLPAFQSSFGVFSGTLRWFQSCSQEKANANRGPVGWREEGIAAGEEAAARYQPDSPER